MSEVAFPCFSIRDPSFRHMPPFTTLTPGLRETLHGALSDPPDTRRLSGLIDTCHALACASLRAKAARGRLYREGTWEITDLAYDCIGELFQRDDGGRLIRMKAYFESFEIHRATDAELLAHLRRLVFSSVNQSLFRIYNDVDPAMGKILRNIKIAIHSLQTFVDIDRLGEPCISPALSDPLMHLPLMDAELLESELARVTTGTEKIPEILSKLSLVLRRQSGFARIVPLITLARAIRGAYASKQIGPRAEHVNEDAVLHADVSAACRWASSVVREAAERTYVVRQNVPASVVDRYFTAIDQYLAGKLDGGAQDLSLYASVVRVFPHIGRGEYNRKHRARVEYLARRVEALALKRLKRN